MRSDLLRPDGFAIGLLILGAVLLVTPLMIVPGVIAIASAFGYWLIIMVVKVIYRRRA